MKPSWGRLEASWTRVGGYLDPSTAILGHLGGHLALSEALLEPSSAKKDPLPPRGGARPDPGRGGGNLPSRERKEVGKGNALDHLRPEGWWDFCPGTVRVRCVWWLFGVIVLTCVRAVKRVLVHAYASSKTHNQMAMCAYTEPRDTRRTTAGQPRGPAQPYWDTRRTTAGHPPDHRGTTQGSDEALLGLSWGLAQPYWAPLGPIM